MNQLCTVSVCVQTILFCQESTNLSYAKLLNFQVIRKHIESTILHEISHVLPTSDEFAKEEEDEDESKWRLESQSITVRRTSVQSMM